MNSRGKNLFAKNETEKLLNTRYTKLARNTIDYWMTPNETEMEYDILINEISRIAPSKKSSLSIYIHVPFCA